MIGVESKQKQKRGSHMDILNTKSIENNRHIKIYFDGGDLSFDAGLNLITLILNTPITEKSV